MVKIIMVLPAHVRYIIFVCCLGLIAGVSIFTIRSEAFAFSLKSNLGTDQATKTLKAGLTQLADLNSAQHIAPLPNTIHRQDTLKRNDTLSDVLDRLGVSRVQAYLALQKIFEAGLLDARKLRPGLKVSAFLRPKAHTDTEPGLMGLSLQPGRHRSILVMREGNDYKVHELRAQIVTQTKYIAAKIQTSLYEAILETGADDQQVVDYTNLFAYDIDFQREIYPDDEFEILYEVFTDERGEILYSGDMIFASFSGKALDKQFYRFTPGDDKITDYYDSTGASARKFLMKTPVNGARLSSNFGPRRHPILGYTKMHNGIDFAAPRGTPIMAAGHGVVERASRYGSYGNYIKIRHANGYQTAYAHLHRYAPGIKSGVRVEQGQIIGYVGSTGRSTGPHLHYEVIKNGKFVNPMHLKLPTGRNLEGNILEVFESERARIDTFLRMQIQSDMVAKVNMDSQNFDQQGLP